MAGKRHGLALSGLGAVAVLGVAVLGVVLAGPATGQVNQQPTAAVTADPAVGQVGSFILLDGTASTDSDGTIVSYSWDFGDGTPIASGNLAEAGQIFHTYGADGVYKVTLTVTDDQGASSDPADPTATVTITIGTGTTPTTVPAVGVSGSQIYAANCAGCHGASGAGGLGPSLQTSTFTTGATVSAVANGVGSMSGFSGSLSQAEIDAVSAYSAGLQSATATTTTTVPGVGVSGSQIYAANCAGCHGASGAGGLGPSLQTSTFTTGATVSAVANGVGSMSGFSGSLSQAEIDAVSAYSAGLQSATATTTTTVPEEAAIDAGAGEGAAAYEANCAACHGSVGEGGIGPSLQTSLFDLDATVDVVANGVGTMPGFSGGLTADQITEVAAYSVALQGGPVAAGDGEPTGDPSTGEDAGSRSGDENIVAIQPSKYVELAEDTGSVPLTAGVELGLALVSMALLGVLVYWEVRRARRARAGSGGSTGNSPNSEHL